MQVCGSNSHGQLGINFPSDLHSFLPLSSSSPSFSSLAFGSNHSLALSHSSKLYTTGSNQRGQIGPGSASTSFQLLPLEIILAALSETDGQELGREGQEWKIEGVAACWETSFLILRGRKGDKLISMGANDWGECGVGMGGTRTKVNLINFRHLFEDKDEGYRIGNMEAGPRHVVLSITACATPSTALVVGWGASRHGQLGTSSPHPRLISIPTLILLPSPTSSPVVKQIALGRDHTVILLSSPSPRRVILFGSNKVGQSTFPSGLIEEEDVVEVACTWSGTYFVTTKRDRIICVGSNSHGQRALP
ncbi:hypothetical protein P7C70_g9585, partial [Phenoliferia sp. Uapishka_3]